MAIKWGRLAAAQRGRFETLSEQERFALFLAMQYGRAIGGEGEPGADGADCVRLALCAATGVAVVGGADALMREVFTVKNPGSDEIQAAFFITRKDRADGEGVARKGTATHVAGVVGRGVVLSFEYPRAVFRTLEELWALCGLWDYSLSIRGLDREALGRVLAEGDDSREGDVRLREYFEEVTQ